jgi:hypothetical protein
MPTADGATYVPDQPETSYSSASGRRQPAEPLRDDARFDRNARYDGGYGRNARYRGDDEDAGYGRDSGYRRGEEEYADPSANRPARAGRSGSRGAERGLPGWLAVLLLVAIAGVCGLIDSLSGTTVRGVFNWGLVAASLIGILVVRRSQMFGVVIAPPLVYLVASAGLLYVRGGGFHNRTKLIDVATNWIVYGFPAIAGATAAVLLIAGIRLVIRR